jgi:LmbE family N-acetylglucosaminyl deacetylase
MFEKSVLISAHPDDEILWFSSILDKVDKLIICFFNSEKKPDLGRRRIQSLSRYPLGNMTPLFLYQSDTFDGADWLNPVVTRFGIRISKKGFSDSKYTANYRKLEIELRNSLRGCKNVFTHNPWGEYGHEDHVQVYRVIANIQQEMKFDLWISNYCSNRSFRLMFEYISGFNSDFITLKTNKKLAKSIKEFYLENRCWTWFPDWEWINEEAFIKNINLAEKTEAHGHIFPINLIKMNFSLPESYSFWQHIKIWKKKLKYFTNIFSSK